MAVTFGAYIAFGVFFKPVLTEFGWTRGLISGAFSLSMVIQGLTGSSEGLDILWFPYRSRLFVDVRD